MYASCSKRNNPKILCKLELQVKKIVHFVVILLCLAASAGTYAQQMQFCVYNKYGQRQGGCYLDKKACDSVVASYNKSNASMGQFCQPEKK
jgi:hypothetical protein